MKRLALVLFLLGVILIATAPADASAPAPDPAQVRPDIFPCSTGCDMQILNPVTVKAKAQRQTAYRLLTMPGCSAGTVPADMIRVEEELQRVGHRLIRNDQTYDFTIRINCGSEQIRICGSVNVYCLGRGFPYNPDVEISDVISTYFPDSRLGVLCHEICGHAIGTWGEQYALCGSSCNFQPTPNLYDYMNTGSNSRHGFSASEFGRWERTMWGLTDCGGGSDPYYDACLRRWVFADGWSVDPVTGVWFNKEGLPEWSPCNADKLRFNYTIQSWMPPPSAFFLVSRGYWSSAGSC